MKQLSIATELKRLNQSIKMSEAALRALLNSRVKAMFDNAETEEQVRALRDSILSAVFNVDSADDLCNEAQSRLAVITAFALDRVRTLKDDPMRPPQADIDRVLEGEQLVPDSENLLYAQCMDKQMKDRKTAQELRDGCIMFWQVYMKTTQYHPWKDKPL